MQYTTIVPDNVAPGSILTCSRCSHKWAIRKKGELPKNCPKCRSTLWMKNYHVYTCMKCEHSWGTANDCPTRCPKCHTSKWNTPAVVRNTRDEAVVSKLPASAKEQIYELYASGLNSIRISIDLKCAYGDVMDALIEKYPGTSIRI